MKYDNLYYNAKISSPDRPTEISAIMLTQNSKTVETTKSGCLDTEVSYDDIAEVRDMRGYFMFPPFVHYTKRFTFLALTRAGINAQNAGKLTSQKLDGLIAANNVGKRDFVFIYNAEFTSSRGEELADALKSYAVFDKTLTCCAVSADILKKIKSIDIKTHSGFFSGDELEENYDFILKAVTDVHPAFLESGLMRLITDAASYGICAFVIPEGECAADALAADAVNSACPIKVYETSEDYNAAIFADAVKTSIDPYARINELVRSRKVTLGDALIAYCGTHFKLDKVPGVLARGAAANFVLTKNHVAKIAAGEAPLEINLLVIGDKTAQLPKSLLPAVKKYMVGKKL